jgi:hypothetical protein
MLPEGAVQRFKAVNNAIRIKNKLLKIEERIIELRPVKVLVLVHIEKIFEVVCSHGAYYLVICSRNQSFFLHFSRWLCGRLGLFHFKRTSASAEVKGDIITVRPYVLLTKSTLLLITDLSLTHT